MSRGHFGGYKVKVALFGLCRLGPFRPVRISISLLLQRSVLTPPKPGGHPEMRKVSLQRGLPIADEATARQHYLCEAVDPPELEYLRFTDIALGADKVKYSDNRIHKLALLPCKFSAISPAAMGCSLLA
jgi:hypothetical protein